ncbi:MAG: PIG-L deacetylase family protein [Candidatus Eremiobacteraeota bacterium]|nr:PIG-L deacetylase family protein [Candidatus Eremiobacteraeota bacterium]
MRKVLVVAVHPDDETLACGGTLLRHKSMGDEVYWLIITEMTKGKGFQEHTIRKRQKEIKRVAEHYGFAKTFQMNIPTACLDQVPLSVLVEKITSILHSLEPEVLYLPFANDVHSDHRIVFQASQSCVKAFRSPFLRTVLMMETISETDNVLDPRGTCFCPNYFVDITEFLDVKVRIMNIYKGETGKHPFPRNSEVLKALALLRGAQAFCRYAEGFMLIKQIV